MTSEKEAGFQGKQAAEGGQAALHAALLASGITITLVGLLHINWLLLVSAVLGVLRILPLHNQSFAFRACQTVCTAILKTCSNIIKTQGRSY